ncbi:MAG: hypothetical protein JWM57_1080 [Phycisphaerales bacterium]|nr:hypothetical protein [Phycisphaerales bacterium]
MARIVDYADVLRQVEILGLRCVYYNTGALGFPAGETPHIAGWLGPDDPTIRPEMAANSVRVPLPYPKNLAEKLGNVWPAVIDGEAWLMPKSHWAFELDHGNGPWLAPALRAVGIDPEMLRPRTTGDAIAFTPGEDGLSGLVETLLQNLNTSDFSVLFPRHRLLLTIHHHQQLWWQAAEQETAQKLQV